MMDYDKLKQAHELAQQRLESGLYTKISIDYVGTRNIIDYRLITSLDGEHDWMFDSINGLLCKLTKLTGLTQPKPLYKDAYYLNRHNEISSTIVLNQEGYVYCDETNKDAFGRTLYPSREALIDAQIEHWQSLRYPTVGDSAKNAEENLKAFTKKFVYKEYQEALS